jgi:hypothetical protein
MMSTVLSPTITTAGLQAVFNASNNGLQAKISAVALGEGSYTPTQDLTELVDERNRIPIASGQSLSDATQIHLNVIDDSDKAFWVCEVGFFLEDGTLFAVYSQPSTSESNQALAYKSPQIDLLLAFDLALSGVPADSVTIIDQGADLNILLAPELARMATAQIDNMTRYLKQKFVLMDAGLLE